MAGVDNQQNNNEKSNSPSRQEIPSPLAEKTDFYQELLALAGDYESLKEILFDLKIPGTDPSLINKLEESRINEIREKIISNQKNQEAPAETEKKESKDNENDSNKNKEDKTELSKSEKDEPRDLDEEDEQPAAPAPRVRLEDRFDKTAKTTKNLKDTARENFKTGAKFNREFLKKPGEIANKSIKTLGGQITNQRKNLNDYWHGRVLVKHNAKKAERENFIGGSESMLTRLALVAFGNLVKDTPVLNLFGGVAQAGAGVLTVLGTKRAVRGLGFVTIAATDGIKGVANYRKNLKWYSNLENVVKQNAYNTWEGIKFSKNPVPRKIYQTANILEKGKKSAMVGGTIGAAVGGPVGAGIGTTVGAFVGSKTGDLKQAEFVVKKGINFADGVTGVVGNVNRGLSAATPAMVTGAILGSIGGGVVAAPAIALASSIVPFALGYVENHIRTRKANTFKHLRSYKDFLKSQKTAAGLDGSPLNAIDRLKLRQEFRTQQLSTNKGRFLADLSESIRNIRDPLVVDNPLALQKRWLTRELNKVGYKTLNEARLANPQVEQALKTKYTAYSKTLNSRGVAYSALKGTFGAINYSLPGLMAGVAIGNPILGIAGGMAAGFGYTFAKTRFPRVFNANIVSGLSGAGTGLFLGVGAAPLLGISGAGILAAGAGGAAFYGSYKYTNALYSGDITKFSTSKLRNASVFKGIHGSALGGLIGVGLGGALGLSGSALILPVAGGIVAGGALRYANTRFYNNALIKTPLWGGTGAGIGAFVGGALFGPAGAIVGGVGGAAIGGGIGYINAKFGFKGGQFGLGKFLGHAGPSVLGMASGGYWARSILDQRADAHRAGKNDFQFFLDTFNPTSTNGLMNIGYGGMFVADTLGSRLMSQSIGGVVLRGASFIPGFNNALVSYSGSIKVAQTLTPSAIGISSISRMIGIGGLIGTVIGGAFGLAVGGGGGAIVGASIGATVGSIVGGVVGAFVGPGGVAIGSALGGTIGGLFGGGLGASAEKAVANTMGGVRDFMGAMRAIMTLSNINWKNLNSVESILALIMALATLGEIAKDADQSKAKNLPENDNQPTAYYNYQNYIYASSEIQYDPIILPDNTSVIYKEKYTKSPNSLSLLAKNSMSNIQKGYWNNYNLASKNTDKNFNNWKICSYQKLPDCSKFIDSKNLYTSIDLINDVFQKDFIDEIQLYNHLNETKQIIFVDERFNINEIDSGYLVLLSNQDPYRVKRQDIVVDQIGILFSIEKDYIQTIEANRVEKENYYTIDLSSPTLNFYNGKYIVGFAKIN